MRKLILSFKQVDGSKESQTFTSFRLYKKIIFDGSFFATAFATIRI